MLRRYTWDGIKEKLQHYRRREPETSALYRLVYHGREELPRVWEERFQATYGVLRDEVLETFDEYLNCGLLCHGAARVYCDACRHSYLVAFSCKKRGVCPSCAAKRAVKFAEHLQEAVLEDVPHRHVVFTLPKRLRIFLRYDRSLNNLLFHAAWGSIEECLGTGQGSPGAVLTVQTAGEALNFNPHLHGLLADGLFGADGSFVPFGEVDREKISGVFAEHVLAALHAKELISDEVVTQILSQAHSGFSVWLGEAFKDSDSERFVARYIERGPVSLEKISIEHDIVTYTTADHAVHESDALEFLALLSTHVPKRYESLTRYYGWYSSRTKGERDKRAAVRDAAEAPLVKEPVIPPSRGWAACIKRIYEIDPLECPRCKAKMRIIAFVQDPLEIKKIMQAQGIQDFRAPPPLPAPPFRDEHLFHDDIPSYI